MFSLSLRHKILLMYSIAVLCTLVIFRLISTQLIRQMLYNDLDDSLEAEIEWIRTVLKGDTLRVVSDQEIQSVIAERSRLSPRKEYIEIYDIEGNEYFRSPNLDKDYLRYISRNQPLGATTVDHFRDESLRVFSVQDPTYEIYVGYPLEQINAVIKNLISSFFVLIPLTLVLLISGGLIMTARFMRPIRELKIYADELVRQPLDEELKIKAGNSADEIGQLVSIINDIVEKMRSNVQQVLSFSTLASHELRTPLAVVRNEFENMLSVKLSGNQCKKMAASIYDEILRLIRVVDILLDLSMMQAGTFKLKLTRVDFCEVLREFHEEAVALAREKNINVDVACGKDVHIEIDVGLIRQALFNLLDNALKHTPKQGRILIRCHIDGSDVILTFADTGTGIPEDILPRIFDLFYRGNVYTSGSSGLGLSLVRWILHQHGGSIDVFSEVDSGTTFTLRLPASPHPTI